MAEPSGRKSPGANGSSPPVIDKTASLSFVGRYFAGSSCIRYLNSEGVPGLFNLPPQSFKQCTLTEGIFKVLRLQTMWREQVLAVFGGTLTAFQQKLLRERGCQTVRPWTEPNHAGVRGSQRTPGNSNWLRTNIAPGSKKPGPSAARVCTSGGATNGNSAGFHCRGASSRDEGVRDTDRGLSTAHEGSDIPEESAPLCGLGELDIMFKRQRLFSRRNRSASSEDSMKYRDSMRLGSSCHVTPRSVTFCSFFAGLVPGILDFRISGVTE